MGLALGVSGERDSWERSFRQVPNTDEDILGFHIDWEPAAWGRIRLSFRNGVRTYDTYEEEDLAIVPPGSREFDQANRTQKHYGLLANFTPVDRFSFGVQIKEQLTPALELQRKAQWRLDFVAAENSMGFHAPAEAARILGESIDFFRQAQLGARSTPVKGAPAAR